MLQQRQVIDMIGQQHARSLGPLPTCQKLLHTVQFFRTVIQPAIPRQPARRAEGMAKSQ
jgi:hypothetical protein